MSSSAASREETAAGFLNKHACGHCTAMLWRSRLLDCMYMQTLQCSVSAPADVILCASLLCMQEAGSRPQHVLADSATAGRGFGAASSAQGTQVNDVSACFDTMQQQQVALAPALTLAACVNLDQSTATCLLCLTLFAKLPDAFGAHASLPPCRPRCWWRG